MRLGAGFMGKGRDSELGIGDSEEKAV